MFISLILALLLLCTRKVQQTHKSIGRFFKLTRLEWTLYSCTSHTLLFRGLPGLPFHSPQSWKAAKQPVCHYSEWPACLHRHPSSNLWKRVRVTVMRIAIRLFFSVALCIFTALVCSPNSNPAIMTACQHQPYHQYDWQSVCVCMRACVCVCVGQMQMVSHTDGWRNAYRPAGWQLTRKTGWLAGWLGMAAWLHKPFDWLDSWPSKSVVA